MIRTFMKFSVLAFFAVGTPYSTYIIVKMILDSISRGFWRGRAGSLTYLATSPKTFWFIVGYMIFFVLALWAVTILLFFAALQRKL